MDPNEALRQIRALASQVWLSIDEVRELQDLVKALDEWIRKGGFLPSDWSSAQNVMLTEAEAVRVASLLRYTEGMASANAGDIALGIRIGQQIEEARQ